VADYKGCNIVEGSLEIELRIGMDSTAADKLVEAFGDIEEIEDFLLVRFTPSFVSLHMFKKLRLIRGQALWRDRYICFYLHFLLTSFLLCFA
jgi:hypothetical protein